MRPLLLGVALALCLAAHLTNAAPAGTELQAEHQQQETLETLHLGEPGSDDTTARDKRTIGPLRQLFPGLSQIVDRKIQQITRSLFRVIGRLVLGGGAGGGNSASASASSTGGSGRKVSITLPTYPPGEDDDDDEEDEDSTAASTSSPDDSSTPAEAENQLAGSESQISEVRVQLNDKQAVPVEAEEEEEEGDLKPAASGDNLETDEGAADLENEAEGGADDENRNKRFLPFNLGGAGGGSGSGSASGNFLFDIIRLIAGSGTTQAQDEADNAPLDGSTSSGGVSASASASANAEGKDDGYQEGVPGPITRLFVIANRGIANLVQDLILRLAQTSERLVNFKARLITSII